MNKPDKERIEKTEELKIRIEKMGGFDNIGIKKLAKHTGKATSNIYRVRNLLEEGKSLHPETLIIYNKALDEIEKELDEIKNEQK